MIVVPSFLFLFVVCFFVSVDHALFACLFLTLFYFYFGFLVLYLCGCDLSRVLHEKNLKMCNDLLRCSTVLR